MAGAHPSVRESSGAFWRPLLLPRGREIWPLWKVSSQRMLSLRMAVGLRARTRSGFSPQPRSDVHQSLRFTLLYLMVYFPLHVPLVAGEWGSQPGRYERRVIMLRETRNNKEHQ